MRFIVLILAAQSHFSFSHFGDKIAVSHLATMPDNLELIGCGIITHHLQICQFYNKADPDNQASCTRSSEANHSDWRNETYRRIWSTVWVSPGWSTRCNESPGVRRASDTVYPIFTSPNAESLTPESQTKPRCSSALTSVCPRGDHISPPPAIMFLADSRMKHDRCEADLWNSLLVNQWCKIHREVKLWPTTWHFGRQNHEDVRSDVLFQHRMHCISSSSAWFWQKYQNLKMVKPAW